MCRKYYKLKKTKTIYILERTEYKILWECISILHPQITSHRATLPGQTLACQPPAMWSPSSPSLQGQEVGEGGSDKVQAEAQHIVKSLVATSRNANAAVDVAGGVRRRHWQALVIDAEKVVRASQIFWIKIFQSIGTETDSISIYLYP